MTNPFDLEAKRTKFIYMLFPEKALPPTPSVSADEIRQAENEPDEQFLVRSESLRIYSVLTLGAIASLRNGDQALTGLRNLREVMKAYYYDSPELWGRTQRIKVDQNNNEYQMGAAVCRDEAKMMERAYSLTGEKSYLREAVISLSEAINISVPGSSENALARMELAIANRTHFDEQIDVPTFHSYFQTIERLHQHAGGLDRKNAATWMYAREMFHAGHYIEAATSFLKLVKTAGIKAAYYPLKEIAKPIFEKQQRQSLTLIHSPNELILK